MNRMFKIMEFRFVLKQSYLFMTTVHGNLVDVHQKKIYPAEVAVDSGKNTIY
jgi:hypothetical protein